MAQYTFEDIPPAVVFLLSIFITVFAVGVPGIVALKYYHEIREFFGFEDLRVQRVDPALNAQVYEGRTPGEREPVVKPGGRAGQPGVPPVPPRPGAGGKGAGKGGPSNGAVSNLAGAGRGPASPSSRGRSGGSDDGRKTPLSPLKSSAESSTGGNVADAGRIPLICTACEGEGCELCDFIKAETLGEEFGYTTGKHPGGPVLGGFLRGDNRTLICTACDGQGCSLCLQICTACDGLGCDLCIHDRWEPTIFPASVRMPGFNAYVEEVLVDSESGSTTPGDSDSDAAEAKPMKSALTQGSLARVKTEEIEKRLMDMRRQQLEHERLAKREAARAEMMRQALDDSTDEDDDDDAT